MNSKGGTQLFCLISFLVDFLFSILILWSGFNLKGSRKSFVGMLQNRVFLFYFMFFLYDFSGRQLNVSLVSFEVFHLCKQPVKHREQAVMMCVRIF